MVWTISLLTPAEEIRRYQYKKIDDYGPLYEEEETVSPKNLRVHTRYCKYYKLISNIIDFIIVKNI